MAKEENNEKATKATPIITLHQSLIQNDDKLIANRFNPINEHRINSSPTLRPIIIHHASKTKQQAPGHFQKPTGHTTKPLNQEKVNSYPIQPIQYNTSNTDKPGNKVNQNFKKREKQLLLRTARMKIDCYY